MASTPSVSRLLSQDLVDLRVASDDLRCPPLVLFGCDLRFALGSEFFEYALKHVTERTVPHIVQECRAQTRGSSFGRNFGRIDFLNNAQQLASGIEYPNCCEPTDCVWRLETSALKIRADVFVSAAEILWY
jgi:hypothetical protein